MTKIELSVIITAYNGAPYLEKAVKEVKKTCEKITKNYEIIIAEDGSTDSTPKLAKKIARKDSKVKHSHFPHKLGKGKAIEEATKIAKGDIIAFTVVDLDIPLKYLPLLVNSIKEGYDIAITSKRHPQSKMKAPFNRTLPSVVYNKLVRIILGSKIYGHNSGMKAFKKKRIELIYPHIKDPHWFWDTELLMIAQWNNFTIREIPISSSYGFNEDSQVNVSSTSRSLLKKIFQLRKRKAKLKGIIR